MRVASVQYMDVDCFNTGTPSAKKHPGKVKASKCIRKLMEDATEHNLQLSYTAVNLNL